MLMMREWYVHKSRHIVFLRTHNRKACSSHHQIVIWICFCICHGIENICQAQKMETNTETSYHRGLEGVQQHPIQPFKSYKCLNCKLYLSEFQIVFVLIVKCILAGVQQHPAIQQRQVVAFTNKFVSESVQLLNRFPHHCQISKVIKLFSFDLLFARSTLINRFPHHCQI